MITVMSDGNNSESMEQKLKVATKDLVNKAGQHLRTQLLKELNLRDSQVRELGERGQEILKYSVMASVREETKKVNQSVEARLDQLETRLDELEAQVQLLARLADAANKSAGEKSRVVDARLAQIERFLW